MATIPFHNFSAADMEQHLANKPIIQLKMGPFHRPTYLLEELVDTQSNHWMVMIIDQDFASYQHHISMTKTDDGYALYDLRYSTPMQPIRNREENSFTKHVFKTSQEAQDYIVKTIKKDQAKNTWHFYFDTIEPYQPKKDKK